MTYTLYYYPGACSLVPHIALEELGLPFVATKAPRPADAQRADYLKNVNALGAVPALVLPDGRVLTQNLAIIDYLAAQVTPNTVLPPPASYERAQAMRWLSFANSDAHPAFKPLFGPGRFLADEAQHPELRAMAAKNVMGLLEGVNAEYAKNTWIAGDFSAADIYLYVLFRWATALKMPIDKLTDYRAMADRMQARDSVKRALATQGIEAI